MIDRDYSFLRLRDNLTDALNQNESRKVDLEYVGQIQLIPGETYSQISNSPTDIQFSGNYEVYLVDHCGNEVQDITSYVYLEEFTDRNGVTQIKWELINNFEYYSKALSLRFRNTVNQDTWYTNLFISTANDVEFTTRFDYKNRDYHYGTDYERAKNFYSSIRLRVFYDDDVNESERSKYHQITTGITVSTRNIESIAERYITEEVSTFVERRIEKMIICDEVYTDGVRSYSSEPLDFSDKEGNSNIGFGEFLLHKDYSLTFSYAFQIFEGIDSPTFTPTGSHLDGTSFTKYRITFTLPITLNTGTVTLYDSGNNVVATYTESDMSVVSDIYLDIDVVGSSGETPAIDSYYLQVSSGLVTVLGVVNYTGVSDTTTWTFNILGAQFDSNNFNNSQFLTN